MRYMMLIYTRERAAEMSAEERADIYDGHSKVIADASAKGIFLGAEPLGRTTTATTVRVENGQTLITDGPFAETKEALAGYYILECPNLDEALEWAARIPTGSKGAGGCIEVRPMPGLPKRPEAVPEHGPSALA